MTSPYFYICFTPQFWPYFTALAIVTHPPRQEHSLWARAWNASRARGCTGSGTVQRKWIIKMQSG